MITKRQIATLSLVVLGVFSSIKAQEANEILKAPVVKKGNAGDAAVASNDDRLAIHVTGRKDANMPTQKYATMLARQAMTPKETVRAGLVADSEGGSKGADPMEPSSGGKAGDAVGHMSSAGAGPKVRSAWKSSYDPNVRLV